MGFSMDKIKLVTEGFEKIELGSTHPVGSDFKVSSYSKSNLHIDWSDWVSSVPVKYATPDIYLERPLIDFKATLIDGAYGNVSPEALVFEIAGRSNIEVVTLDDYDI